MALKEAFNYILQSSILAVEITVIVFKIIFHENADDYCIAANRFVSIHCSQEKRNKQEEKYYVLIYSSDVYFLNYVLHVFCIHCKESIEL